MTRLEIKARRNKAIDGFLHVLNAGTFAPDEQGRHYAI